MNILLKILNWLKRISFIRTKLILFSTLMTGLMLDVFIKVDLQNLTFQYGNNTSSSIVLIGLILTCIIFASFDFWLEKIKIKERTNEKMLDAIRDSNVSESIKESIKDLLLSKK